MAPLLMLVIPCYNEQKVLPITAPQFLNKITELAQKGKVSENSKVMFVDDGSSDSTWKIISALAKADSRYCGLRLSRNRGHQNALFAGLMAAKDNCDISISVDCDGQDDINAIDKMVDEYLSGSEIVYGVRNSRKSDTFFKRNTARSFYKLMNFLGVETVYDHADYRLISAVVLKALSQYKEVNIYLRGMIPLVGYKSSCVSYERKSRMAGESHYPFKKMLSLAFDGVTSLSVKPIRIITVFGFLVSIISFIGIVWSVITFFAGRTVAGWASTVSIICFFSGVQLLSIGIIGEYIGKIYLETKQRPRYIIEDKTNI